MAPQTVCAHCGFRNASISHFCARCEQPLRTGEADAPLSSVLVPTPTPAATAPAPAGRRPDGLPVPLRGTATAPLAAPRREGAPAARPPAGQAQADGGSDRTEITQAPTLRRPASPARPIATDAETQVRAVPLPSPRAAARPTVPDPLASRAEPSRQAPTPPTPPTQPTPLRAAEPTAAHLRAPPLPRPAAAARPQRLTDAATEEAAPEDVLRAQLRQGGRAPRTAAAAAASAARQPAPPKADAAQAPAAGQAPAPWWRRLLPNAAVRAAKAAAATASAIDPTQAAAGPGEADARPAQPPRADAAVRRAWPTPVPGTLARQLGAGVIDAAVGLAAAVAWALVEMALLRGGWPSERATGLEALAWWLYVYHRSARRVVLVTLVAMAAHSAWGVRRGQTLGRKLFGLQLVAAPGGLADQAPGGREAAPAAWAVAGWHLLGNAVCWLSLGAGFYWMVVDDRGRSWANLVSRTVVQRRA